MKSELTKQPQMVITYEKGEKIIVHPSGHVNKYTDKDLQAQKDAIVAQIAQLTAQLKEMDADIDMAKAAK